MKPTLADTTIGLGAVLDRCSVLRKDLAHELDVAPETVTRWCSGALVPGGRTVLRIVSVLRRYEPLLRVEDLFAKDGRSQEGE